MKKRTGIERLKVRYGRLFVVPWCIGFLLFFLIPLLSSIGYAFSDVSLISENHMTFAGSSIFAICCWKIRIMSTIFGTQ